MTRCKRCGRQLTVRESVRQEHGPVCILRVFREIVLDVMFKQLTGTHKSRTVLRHKQNKLRIIKSRGGRHGRR